jgi:hypothetical protein
MGLVKADEFILQLMNVGEVWLAGLKGSGKSLVAVAIAEELIARDVVSGCISNMPVSLPLPDWRKLLLRDVAIILDEAHHFIDNRRSMFNDKGYGAQTRKLNILWIFPSVYPIDVRMRSMRVQRVSRMSIPGVRVLIQLLRHVPVLGWLIRRTAIDWFGSEIWVYQWDLDLLYTKGQGRFWLVKPEQYYLKFDTSYGSPTDAGILDLFQATMEESLRNDVGEGTFYVNECDLTELERDLLEEERGKYSRAATDGFAAIASKIRNSSRSPSGADGGEG